MSRRSDYWSDDEAEAYTAERQRSTAPEADLAGDHAWADRVEQSESAASELERIWRNR